MKIEQLTNTRRACKILAQGPTQGYSWGALQVTLEVRSDTEDKHYHITMVKAELVEALALITNREEEIKPSVNLDDEFDSNQPEHFTHYDYLCQLVKNGQPTAFAQHITLLNNDALIRLLKCIPKVGVGIYIAYTEDEIFSRMAGK